MYPSRLPFVHVFFPSWCGFSGSAALLVCEGSGGTGAGPGAPGGPTPGGPPKSPCNGPNCCKHCFDTAKFANWLITNTAGRTGTTTGRPGKENSDSTYCGWYVGRALQEGGASVPIGDGASYAQSLPSAGFEVIASYANPARTTPILGSQIGDVTVFGAAAGHGDGHVEGYEGKVGNNLSGWASYWQQGHWYPYGVKSRKTGLPIPPAGPAKIFRSKCPCGQ